MQQQATTTKLPFEAYVFDAYGTLFDVHSAVARFAEKLGPSAPTFSQLWRTKQLEYSWVHSLMGQYVDFWVLTERALDFAFASHPDVDKSLRDDLLSAYQTLDCYAEVKPVLSTLKEQGARLAILSNGSPVMLEYAVESADLGTVLHDIFSVDYLKTFKTDPRTYQMVSDEFGIKPENIAFQSSNRWDIAGARAFGFHTNWINRSGAIDEYPDQPPHKQLNDLTSLMLHEA